MERQRLYADVSCVLGTNPSALSNIKDTTGEGLVLIPLLNSTTYYWRIDAAGSIGTATGTLYGRSIRKIT